MTDLYDSFAFVIAEPKRLVEGTIVDGFIPDPALSWTAAYAGPCGDPECEEPHSRLYLIPVIGWLRVVVMRSEPEYDDLQLRPAIMSAQGIVTDYLDVPEDFKLIAILRTGDNLTPIARAIYHERFGEDEEILIEEKTQQLPN